MKRLILPMLFLAIFEFCFGQKPVTSGFMGSRNYVAFNYRMGVRTTISEKAVPAEEDESLPYKYQSIEKFYLKNATEIRAGRVLNNNLAIELIVGRNKTAFDLNRFSTSDILFINGNIIYNDGYKGISEVTQLHGGYGFKFYRRKKGAIAPIGSFITFYQTLTKYTIDVSHVKYYENYNFDYHISRTFPTDELKYSFLGTNLRFGVGTNRVIGSNIILGGGVDTGLSLIQYKRTSTYHGYLTLQDLTYKTILKNEQRYQLFWSYFSIGYLF